MVGKAWLVQALLLSLRPAIRRDGSLPICSEALCSSPIGVADSRLLNMSLPSEELARAASSHHTYIRLRFRLVGPVPLA
jgi:hypothetical protein